MRRSALALRTAATSSADRDLEDAALGFDSTLRDADAAALGLDRDALPDAPADDPARANGFDSTLRSADAEALALDRDALPQTTSADDPEASLPVGFHSTLLTADAAALGLDRDALPPLGGDDRRRQRARTPPTADDPSSARDRAKILGNLRGVAGPRAHTEAAGADGDSIRGHLLGRYLLLDRLGEGGMGVVYAAYDPELDRKIALKLVHTQSADDPEAARGRLLREAQAMAKLSHPNVVTVHDVGTVDGRVYLAMEHVRGLPLDAWREAESPGWEAILAVFRQAGAGLAAAHAANLIHRDFKPQNVMVADDGRVLVMDFGLARAESSSLESSTAAVRVTASALDLKLTNVGAIIGTPAYMAPEQFEGAEADARSDQFSFAVALWESLYGEPPFVGETFLDLRDAVTGGELRAPKSSRGVPGWLRKVLERGLAANPFDRWPTMDALLEALSHDPTRRRRAFATIAGVLLVGAAALVAQAVHERNVRAECRHAAAGVDAIWGEQPRLALRRKLVGGGSQSVDARLSGVTPALDHWASAWRSARRDVCAANRLDGTLSDELSDRARDCLAGELVGFASHVERLVSEGDTNLALSTSAALPAIDHCVDRERLAKRPLAPPVTGAAARALRAQLAIAATSARAGDLSGGLARTEAALGAAERLAWPPVLVAARGQLGALLSEHGDLARGEAALRLTYRQARAAGVGDASADAALALVANVGVAQARPAEGRLWADVAAAELDALGESERRRMADLEALRGRLAAADGHNESAEEHLRAAIRRYEALLDGDDPALAAPERALAEVLVASGQIDAAIPHFDRALGLQSDGDDLVATLVAKAAALERLGHAEAAEASLRRALSLGEQASGAESPAAAALHRRLADLLASGESRGAEALSHYERTLAILTATAPERSTELATLDLDIAATLAGGGRSAAALEHVNAALERVDTEASPTDPEAARDLQVDALTLRVALRRSAGELDQARADLARARLLIDAAPPASADRRAALHLAAADLLVAEGDLRGARESAERGRDEAVSAGPAGVQLLAAVEGWLADPAHAEPPSAGAARTPRQPARAPSVP